MDLIILQYIYYSLVLLFGVFVSASFIGIQLSKKNIVLLISFSAFLGFLQGISSVFFGINNTYKLYPLITHFPLVVFYSVVYRKKIISSIITVTSAYLCLQINNWISSFFMYLTNSSKTYYIIYIISTLFFAYFIIKYFSKTFSFIHSKSIYTVLLIGSVSIVYYIFDYTTTIYSQMLYSGKTVFVEFIPFVLCAFYLAFIISYYKKQEQLFKMEQREKLINIQVKQTIKSLETIKNSEYEISLIRHDMRHYLNHISSLITNEDYSNVQNYINELRTNIDNTTVKKFCNNDFINIILSFYNHKMTEQNISFITNVVLTKDIPCPELEFSSILSNGIENAINAVSIIDGNNRFVDLSITMNNNKLLLSIKNPYSKSPNFVDGIPTSQEKNHGLGTQSIQYMVYKLHGNCQFMCENNLFILRVVL